MLIRLLYVHALLISSIAAAVIDCSREDSCFGEPIDCDPDRECNTLLQFYPNGSADLFLRDFTDPIGYAAFAIGHHPDETIEYFICIPHERQRLRALAELRGPIVVTEQNLTNVVDKIGENFFQCHVEASELPELFKQEQSFFVSKGSLKEGLVIFDGVQLHNLELEDDDIDNDFDQDAILPSIHYIGSPIDRSFADTDTLFTSDEIKSLSDAVINIPKVTDGKDDLELEELARRQTIRNSRRLLDSDISKSRFQDDDEEVEHSHMPRSRASRYEEVNVMSEKDESSKKRSTSSHRQHYDDFEEDENEVPRMKNNRRIRQDEEDNDEDYSRNRGKKNEKAIEKNDKLDNGSDEFYDDDTNVASDYKITSIHLSLPMLIAFFI
ncbi:unnamed protein product [Caenorhabditis sp. 36 PRJEB53466]|nr:unnamed protein product [Caenorhabditis sp. 36 PRJEB53466]